jgi:hypothetical protein
MAHAGAAAASHSHGKVRMKWARLAADAGAGAIMDRHNKTRLFVPQMKRA